MRKYGIWHISPRPPTLIQNFLWHWKTCLKPIFKHHNYFSHFISDSISSEHYSPYEQVSVTSCARENKESENVGHASIKVFDSCEFRHKVSLKVKKERILGRARTFYETPDLFQTPSDPPMWWEAAHKRAQEVESCRWRPRRRQSPERHSKSRSLWRKTTTPLQDLSQKLPQKPYFLSTHNCSVSKRITAALFNQIVSLDCLKSKFTYT